MTTRTAVLFSRDFSFIAGVVCFLLLFAPFYYWQVEYAQDDGGFPASLVETLPDDQPTLKNLAAILSNHNEQAYRDIRQDSNFIWSLGFVKKHYPERFLAPHSWFEAVESNKEITDRQIGSLVRLAEEKVLSTDDAANWILTVSREIEVKSSSGYRQQEEARALLKERLNKNQQ